MAVSIGIELGPSGIRAAVVERTSGRAVLRGADDTAADTSDRDALTRALSQVRRTLGIRSPVVLGIPGTSVILSTVTPLIVNLRRASLAVEFELQQQLPFDVGAAAWHYQWLAPSNGSTASKPGESGPRGAVVAAMRRSLLAERIACCQRAGLSVRAVGVTPVAVLNAWQGRRPGTSLPPEAVLLNVSHLPTAEWIVLKRGALEVITITGASRERCWDELGTSWRAVQAAVSLPVETVWMVGSTEDAGRLAQVMGGAAAPKVERFTPSQVVSGAFGDHPERLTAAVGLALQGQGEARVPVNLLAGLQAADQADRVQRAATIAGGVCLAAAIGFGASGMLEVRARRLRVLQALSRREQLYQSLRPEVRALLQRQDATEQRRQQLLRLCADAPRAGQLLASITGALPDTVWLTKFDCAKAPGVTAQLEGRGKAFQDVTQLLDRLKALPGVAAVRPLATTVTPDAESGREVVVFSIEVQFTPAATGNAS